MCNDDDNELMMAYKESLKQARSLVPADEAEKKVINGMISDLEYAIKWLKKGFDPSFYNGSGRGVFKGNGGYDKRKVSLPLEMFGVIDPYKITSEEDEKQLTNYQKKTISNCLSILTDKQFAAFVLHECNMRTYEEISLELGVSKGTVQSHIEAAKRKIEKFRDKVDFPLSG